MEHTHPKIVCSCGVILRQCKCPGEKPIQVSDKPCTHNPKSETAEIGT